MLPALRARVASVGALRRSSFIPAEFGAADEESRRAVNVSIPAPDIDLGCEVSKRYIVQGQLALRLTQ